MDQFVIKVAATVISAAIIATGAFMFQVERRLSNIEARLGIVAEVR